jgi:hypothetical protein
VSKSTIGTEKLVDDAQRSRIVGRAFRTVIYKETTMSLKNVLVAIFVCATGALAMGCGGDACDELSDKCDSCSDSNEKSGCQLTVAFDDADACQSVLDGETCD